MKVTLLGTGTPTPSLDAASSGYLIEIGKDVIVVDHGPGAHHRLLQTGKRATDVTHVFLSHLHYDHCLDYPRLVLQRWDIGADRIPDLKVYGPSPIQQMTDLMVGEQGAFAPDITARIKHQGSIDVFEARGGHAPRKWPKPQVREVKPQDTIAGDGWSVKVAEGSHMQPYLNCYGYRFDCPEGSLCYSGDSGGICENIVDLAKGADVLIHMCHYFSGTEPSEIYRAVCGNHIDTAHVAQKAGVKTLVLTHKLEQIERPGVRERIISEMSKIYDGVIIWGQDLMVVPFGGAQLGRIE